ncbi:MAG: hypothetical protein KatS3mg057_2970 [Herpetosiphonaceae bacterium]|nr:MAG: hypothetical protein KatS3mg057_2970 [Herpetosiphonaceae bacterium]
MNFVVNHIHRDKVAGRNLSGSLFLININVVDLLAQICLECKYRTMRRSDGKKSGTTEAAVSLEQGEHLASVRAITSRKSYADRGSLKEKVLP